MVMQELINNSPFTIWLLIFIPAILTGGIIYFLLNRNWRSKYGELNGYYEQSQRDTSGLRNELNELKEQLSEQQEKVKFFEAEKERSESRITELENELIEEIQEKNEKITSFQLRMDELEKELSSEKLKFEALKELEAKENVFSQFDSANPVREKKIEVKEEEKEESSIKRSLTNLWNLFKSSDKESVDKDTTTNKK